ncbi:hypothetical protein [Patulibacter defluvii]|uniref:hypothetical protein n=1 Tax=Patulibacter defluvii TaxID=3095358 RepID=UPI002A75C85B|nr:hypothetical protein [Patulibacter sp. DM4]
MEDPRLTRRTVLGRAAAGASGLALAGALGGGRVAAATAGSRGVVPLPGAAELRADIQRMVDFGPRLTGTPAHERFIAWIERELEAAGATVIARDEHELTSWEATGRALELRGGPSPGPVRVATQVTRSRETGPAGVTGPLVYGGALPLPSVNTLGTDLQGLLSALDRYPAELLSAVTALVAQIPRMSMRGAIVVVDLPLPLPLPESTFLPLLSGFHWPGHSVADIALRDYKRLWIPLGTSTGVFEQAGAAGVVFVFDASYEALEGNDSPFLGPFEPLPALCVDRDAGRRLREAAAAGADAHLTLTANRRRTTSPSIVAVLPGSSDEATILNTHTDGQNFAEENGAVAMVHLARHFGSLPRGQRLKRSLVFSAVTGHMASGLPQTEGFIEDHPELVRCAAAAITIEHLGCTEWVDVVGRGYRATGDPEMLGLWVSDTQLRGQVMASVREHAIPHTVFVRPGLQFGIGGAFQTAGVPQVGFLAGPNYLVSITENGHMDKLDAELAARQVRWTADMIRRIDRMSLAELRTGDPLLRPRTTAGCPRFPVRPPRPAAPATRVVLRLRIDRTSARGLRRRGWLRGRLRVGAPGRVRLRATVERLGGHRVRSRLAEDVVRVGRPGTRRFSLRLTARGRRALRSGRRFRVTVVGRSHQDGRLLRRTARRTIGR